MDGELRAEERKLIESHLRECLACRRQYEQFRFAASAISQLVLPEAPPQGMPDWRLPKQPMATPLRSRRLWKILVPAAAAVVILTAVLVWRFSDLSYPSPVTSWQVIRLSGAPLIQSQRMAKTAALKVGEWLETDGSSRAMLDAGLIGRVEIDSGTRIGLTKTATNEERLSLQRGRIFAAINAPPRLFFVETPSATAIDLGCAYTLEVDEAGISTVRVTSGAVALNFKGRESFVPAGAICQSRPGKGPGTPYLEGASERFKQSLAEFDFQNGKEDALAVVLDEAHKEDAISLWNLLQRVEGAEREQVYTKLAALVPFPQDTTREGLLQLDEQMLAKWERRIEEVNTLRKQPAIAPGVLRMTGTMETARYAHKATLLSDGRVLVTGGISTADNRKALASTEIYDPATGEFIRGADMNAKRATHTATLLNTGKVLITGGSAGESPFGELASAELYDPETQTFSPTGNMTTARGGHEATLLADGKVLITGGVGRDGNDPALASAELYDPDSGTFTPVGSMSRSRVDHTATRLADGKVLIAGGFALNELAMKPSLSAELYDPIQRSFVQTGSMNTPRFKHSAVLLPNGKILICGGADAGNHSQITLTSVELYDPSNGKFTYAGNTNFPRYKVKSSAVLLSNGKVLIAGGGWGIEVYDPKTGIFSFRVDGIQIERYYLTATLLPNGEVVIIGGYGTIARNRVQANANAWIYQSQ
jgi:hypothetical protein